MKKTYLSFACFFGLWLVAALLSYDVAFWTKGVAQFFATGVSAYKDFFFLFWATLCFAVLAFHPGPIRKISSRFPLTLIGALGAINLASFFWLVKKLGLDGKSRMFAVAGEVVSSNNFSHTHTMKPMLMPFVNGLGLQKLLKITDPGGPYYELFPHWIYFFSLLLVLALSFLVIRMLIQKRDEWEPEFRLAFILTYVVASYVVVKCMFDGGPLSPEFVVFFPVLILLLYARQSKWGKLCWSYAASLSLAVGLAFLMWVNFSPSTTDTLLVRIAATAPFPIFLVAATHMARNRRATWPLMLVLFFSTGVLIWGASRYLWISTYRIMNYRLTPSDKVYLTNPTGENYEYPVAYQEGKLKVHAFKAPGTTMGDVHRAIGIPVGYGRTSVVGWNCFEGIEGMGYLSSGEVIMVRGAELDMTKTSDIFKNFNLEAIEQGRRYRYSANIKGCLPNGNNELVINHLREMGFQLFVIVPDSLSR